MRDSLNSNTSRLLPVDALRGLIIVVMALDHANYFVAQKHSSGEYWGGPFPIYSDALTFLTRFVTHLAAPGFFFLMGTGMLLFARSRREQGWSRWEVIRHFLIRGALLMALQLLLVNQAWELSPGGWGLTIYVGVLFALGGTMMLGSFLLWLKPRLLIGLTVLLFLGTELLVPAPGLWNTIGQPDLFVRLNSILIIPGGDAILWANYPIFPWLELVTFGMVFGYWLRDDPSRAYRRGFGLGVAFLLAFLTLRWLNGFGNIRPRAGDSWIDILNVVKYPPSMTFTLLTTGLNLILLRMFAQVRDKGRIFLEPLAVFGRAPLFFYLTHLFLYAALGRLFAPDGVTVPAMYPYWLLGLLILYPLCLWFGGFKRRQAVTSAWRFL